MGRRALGVTFVIVALVAIGVALAPSVGLSVVARVIAWRHPEVATISSEELARALASDAPPVLVDARSVEEIAVSTLGPIAEPAAHDADVVVYCSVGARSAALAERLRAAGYARVRNLEGGIFGWANEGRPLWRGATRVDEVHPFDALWGLLLSPRVARASGGS